MGRALPQRRREQRLWTLFRSRGQRQLLQRWRPATGPRSWLPTSRRAWMSWPGGCCGTCGGRAKGVSTAMYFANGPDLTPVELRSLLMRMGRVLQRFRRERGMALSRPVAANSPLQSYFMDAEFAAVASDLFGERMPDQQSGGLRRP